MTQHRPASRASTIAVVTGVILANQARACGPGLAPGCSAVAFAVALAALTAVLPLLAALTLTALALTSVALTRLPAVLLLSVLRPLARLLAVLAVRLLVLRTHSRSSLA